MASGDDILDRYIHEALRSNLSIQQLKAQLDELRAHRDEAYSAFFPRIDFNARYSRAGGGRTFRIDPSRFLEGSLPPGIELGDPVEVHFLREEEHDTRFSLNQPIFTGGRIRSAYNASRMELKSGQAELAAQKSRIIFDVSEAYYQYVLGSRLVEIAAENKSLAEEHLRVAHKLYDAEQVALNDVYRAEVQLSAMEQELAENQNALRLAGFYFNRLLDNALEDKIEISQDINIPENDAITDMLSVSADDYKSRAEENRFELKQIRHNLDALENLKGLYRAEYYPQLALSAVYGWEGEKYRFGFDHDYWNVSLLLNFNVFDFGSRGDRIEQVEAQKSRIEYVQEDIRNAISLEVSRAWYELENLHVQWLAVRKQVKSAEENFRITSVQYENGLASQIEFLDAQTALFSANQKQAVLYYQIKTAEAALRKAAGLDYQRYVTAD